MRNKKKGFTLVELLVVIAILAVLATVSVVGYLSFTKKANVSNDISLTKQMNTVLKANEVSKKPEYPSEINSQLKENGLDLTKINTYTKGYTYVWDKASNSILLLDENKKVVAPEGFVDNNKADTYVVVHNNSDILANNGYAIYIASNFSEKEALVEKTALIDSDFDNVHLKASTKEIFNIHTNSFENAVLNVDAPLSDVNHYGKAKMSNVVSVAENSYNLYGSVSNIKLSKGHAHIQGQSAVSYIFVEQPSVKVTIDNQVIEPEKINVVFGSGVESTQVNISAPQSVTTIAQNVVATINNRTYTSLDAAYKEANVNDTIKLVKSVEVDYTFDKNVIIDGLGTSSICGTSTIQNGTFNNVRFTNGANKSTNIYTLGNTLENITISLNNCITEYPVLNHGNKTVTHILNGNNATININNSKFINNPQNNGLTENAPQWSFGLSFGTQGAKGFVNIDNILFDGAFRTMLPSINGNVNISNSRFVNSVFSINFDAGGSQQEATCITTGTGEHNFIISNNIFDNSGSFYFQVTKNVQLINNTIKMDRFSHFLQVRGSAGAQLDFSRNEFVMGENLLVVVDYAAAPVILPVGQKAVNYWVWSNTPKDVKPVDYSSYVYWYNADGSRTFAPTTQAAYDAFKNPVKGNIGFDATKDTMIWNNK